MTDQQGDTSAALFKAFSAGQLQLYVDGSLCVNRQRRIVQPQLQIHMISGVGYVSTLDCRPEDEKLSSDMFVTAIFCCLVCFFKPPTDSGCPE